MRLGKKDTSEKPGRLPDACSVRSSLGYIIGAAALAAAMGFFCLAFFFMSQAEIEDIDLTDSPESGLGWQYEKFADGEVTPVEPDFLNGMVTAGDGHADAVRITRVITEELSYPYLELLLYDPQTAGAEVFLDGELLYSRFGTGTRNSDGFLIFENGAAPQTSQIGRDISISLPESCVGCTVSITLYYTADAQSATVIFPALCSFDTETSIPSTETVTPVVIETLCAVFAVIAAMIFILDISRNGKIYYSTLLLVIFFVMLFIDKAYASLPGTYSALRSHIDLSFLSSLYIAPLLLYIAFRLTGWRKYTLLPLTAGWVVYELICMTAKSEFAVFATNGLVAFLLFAAAAILLIVEFFFRKSGRLRVNPAYIAVAAVSAVITVLYGSQEFMGNVFDYLYSVVICISDGWFIPAVKLLSNFLALLMIILLSIEFAKRTLRKREQLSALEERVKMSVESYRRMAEAENATAASRHEMRHHVLALKGLIENNETERARDYLSSMQTELEELPTGKYCRNMMVDLLAGAYLDRAKAIGAEIKYQFNIPEKLEIADNDLCVFLTNMLENAVRACEQTEPDKRRISLTVGLNGNFLFIGCENSCPPQETEDMGRRPYGTENMRRIAKKYNGIIEINKTESSYSVMSSLCLKG